MDSATLPTSADQHFGDGLLQSAVVVTDGELDARHPALAQTTQELCPESSVLGVTNGDAQHFTLAGDGHPRRDHDGAAQHAPPPAP